MATPQPAAVKRCRRCGTNVQGDHAARVEHLKACSGSADGGDVRSLEVHAATPEPTMIRPLPVCPGCGKLFRSHGLLGEHECAWSKRAKEEGTDAAQDTAPALGRRERQLQ